MKYAHISVRRTTVITSTLSGVIALLVGGRLIYTEIARNRMMDYEEQTKAIVNNPRLIATWEETERRVNKKYEIIIARNIERCQMNKEQAREYEEEVEKYEFMPSSVKVNAEAHCLDRASKLGQSMEEEKKREIEDLGTYQNWAIDQSGIDKHHPWLRYPEDLRKRILLGERGLLIGNPLKYIF
jgi:hypothetical protein